ncbi:MAG: hypothetical protein AAFR91_01285 [Pseudomonadota bacterium]
MNAVKHIMLIDDSDDDNYIHQRVITRADFADKVTVFNYTHQALEFLRVTPNSVVDIIFSRYQHAEDGWVRISGGVRTTPNAAACG